MNSTDQYVGRGSGQPLFERIPDRLFAPLASPNRHRYWQLLCVLHERRFGPDAPLPPSVGFPMREINREIEDQLRLQDDWEPEEAAVPETPIGIRAIEVFNRLHESGWLRVDRHGVRDMVCMAPAVAQFMTRLVEFAQTGPVFVAGKVRSIEANLLLIVNAKADGDTLQEAALQARNLLEHVRNTGTNIRDLMSSLSLETTTAEYVRRFFSDYIERVFIGDYRELRTREHPLARRQQILEIIESVHADAAQRNRLVAWYESKRTQGDRRRAEAQFEKDVDRLRDLQRIDEYLDRLDDEIRRANKRALAFLDYRLKSLRPVDRLVAQAIAKVLKESSAVQDGPFAPGVLMSAALLAMPRRDLERRAPSALRTQAVSLQEEARARVLLRARNARFINPVQLAEFVSRALGERECVSSDELSISSITDLRALQTLSVLSIAWGSNSRTLRLWAMGMGRGLTVNPGGGDETPGEWISLKPFLVSRRSRRAQGGVT